MRAQCSRCDAVAECLDSAITTLEDVAGVIGCPTPSLHVHLVQHDRDDLLRCLTYGGEPILPEEPAKDPGVQDDQPAKDPGVQADPAPNEWPEDTDPQEFVDAGLIDPDDLEDPQAGADDEQQRTPPRVTPFMLQWLGGLRDEHPAETVRAAAAQLLTAIDDHENTVLDRLRLEQLVAQRDQLTAEIEALHRRLGDPPAQQPTTTPAPKTPAPARQKLNIDMSDVRAWARKNGHPVKPTGKMPGAVVDAYLRAHSKQVS